MAALRQVEAREAAAVRSEHQEAVAVGTARASRARGPDARCALATVVEACGDGSPVVR